VWGFLRGLLDRLVLIAAVLAAGTVPGFIAQYRQRVGGMLAQVQADLAPFIEIARRFHAGDLERLIAHHRASSDPTFRAEGDAIATMRDSADRLQDAHTALETDLVGQLLYLAQSVDSGIARATWEIFEPSFSFSPSGIAFALVVGLGAWLVYSLLAGLIAALFTPRR
jgi:hypothetical protein